MSFAGTTRQRRTAFAALLVIAAILAVWALWPEPDPRKPAEAGPPAPQTVLAGTKLRPVVCGRPATKPFVPTRISVSKVTTDADVEALPRDANNVPSAIPVGAANAKIAFAWDEPTIKPGEKKGNVLLNAHTWPDGTALGNHLLDKLQVGGRIILRGKHGAELCYTVTKRDVIAAADGSFEYYEKDGPHQVALIVCSPPRLGPGNWKNRTIWYASPLGTARANAAQAS